jgi:UDP-2,4-diacetamido-2,4,6-trideoxy-beta-L-altropyranose hydrolase
MRCLTLADELRGGGSEVVFLTAPYEGNINARIEERGYEMRAVAVDETGWTWEDDRSATRAALRSLTPDVLLVDRYGIDARWEKAMRDITRRIAVIDDLADRPHDADLLIDQNWYAGYERRYDTLLSDRCERLLGPRYAMLGPAYRALPPRPTSTSVARVLIFFGGSDPTGETIKALETFASLGRPSLACDLVIGGGNPRAGEVKRRAGGVAGVVVHENVAHLASLMRGADLALGAGGMTTWERFAAGLPAITVSVAPNQERHLSELANAGALVYLGRADEVDLEWWRTAIVFALDAPQFRRALADRGRGMVDGGGAARIARRIVPSTVSVRLADEADGERIYRWRNHPDVRGASFDNGEIPFEAHAAWFRSTLDNERRALLVAERDGDPMGVVRYDLEGDEALVSVYLAPGMTGRGWGQAMIEAADRWMVAHRPTIRRVRAEIIPDNLASCRAFAAAGYREERRIYYKETNASA